MVTSHPPEESSGGWCYSGAWRYVDVLNVEQRVTFSVELTHPLTLELFRLGTRSSDTHLVLNLVDGVQSLVAEPL